MSKNPYAVGYYRDHGDQRNNRYAVHDTTTGVWYFPKRYGIKACNDFCVRLNKIAAGAD